MWKALLQIAPIGNQQAVCMKHANSIRSDVSRNPNRDYFCHAQSRSNGNN
jgi:hypothetical protein